MAGSEVALILCCYRSLDRAKEQGLQQEPWGETRQQKYPSEGQRGRSESQQVLLAYLPRVKFSEAYACSFPLQEITHPLGNFLKTVWKLASRPPKMLSEEKLCKVSSA